MRHIKWFLPMTAVVALGLFGCGKSSSPPPPATKTVPTTTPTTQSTDTTPAEAAIDVSKLKAVFPDDVSISDVIGFINDKDYARALPLLQPFAKNAKLSPAQKQAVNEIIAALKSASGSN